jgi:CP family cyanate transporter-like MFS transporter
MSEPKTPPALPTSRAYLAVAFVLLAFNARPALSTIGPVLPEALAATGVSSGEAWIFTTAPVVMVGLFGLWAPRLARRVGVERAILGLNLVLALALGLRAFGTAAALAMGCALAGGAIGAANVLLPSLIKRDFADRAPLMTGLYTMALCGGAAIAAGTVVPLERALGGNWALALAFWAIPALVAALAFSPLAVRATKGPAQPGLAWIWRDKLAWTVTLFMGLQSSIAYSVFAWLAPLLRDRGLDPVAAGLAVSVSVMIQAPVALAAPHLAAKLGKDQRGGIAFGLGMTLAGLGLVLFGPLSAVWVSVLILGVGQGAVFAMALMVIVYRARDAQSAASLSSMAQGVGYCLAAAGPLAMGWLREATGGWTWPGMVMIGAGVLSLAFGWSAGRAVHIGAAPKA